ncbi:FkbM family methyltransferase [Flavobacterium anhuiense]|uniref:FkbM family methyltransferase n=1 Tax=Flavobacterium anhuiense TaxID=459526 RepID=UPI003D994DBD
MKFKKLRRIYRTLFPVKFSEEQKFINKLKASSLIKEFKQFNSLFVLKFYNDELIYLRDQSHSDYAVFNQMFILEEYKTVSSILKLNIEFNSKESVLIDAGANVGFATIYLNQNLSFNKIFCIEPSKENFKILKKNTAALNSKHILFLINKALSGSENVCFTIENDFRDGKDWSITTKESDSGDIKGITLNEIVKKNNLQEITLLKIDIEGAERFVFESSSDLSFLDITKVIVIEIHDEFNIRANIYSILEQKQFILIESGETTIGINKKHLKF